MKSSPARIGRVRMKDSGLVVYRPQFGAGSKAHAGFARETAYILSSSPDIEAYYVVYWVKGRWESTYSFPHDGKFQRHLMPAMIGELVRESMVTDPAIDARLSDD